MEQIEFPPDFSEFLKSLTDHRMGQAPIRIEILTDIDGVEFAECASRSQTTSVDGTQVPVISLRDLKTNKKACGRAKDLDDLENLPPG